MAKSIGPAKVQAYADRNGVPPSTPIDGELVREHQAIMERGEGDSPSLDSWPPTVGTWPMLVTCHRCRCQVTVDQVLGADNVAFIKSQDIDALARLGSEAFRGRENGAIATWWEALRAWNAGGKCADPVVGEYFELQSKYYYGELS